MTIKTILKDSSLTVALIAVYVIIFTIEAGKRGL